MKGRYVFWLAILWTIQFVCIYKSVIFIHSSEHNGDIALDYCVLVVVFLFINLIISIVTENTPIEKINAIYLVCLIIYNSFILIKKIINKINNLADKYLEV